ncbi:hypothetical protein HOD38_05305 [archaeon]|jgi:hypothetical protein|nr:hypothetical protein [archaeon]MBT4397657.1 hypothetical protein [archaeon]MBT4441647.1 hypothetical protein [archaeon]
MKAEKIIGILILLVLLAIGGIFIYSGIMDLQAEEEPTENPLTIIIDDGDDDEISTNSCPVLESVSDVDMTVGDKLTVLAYADDDDGDSITYTFSNLPDAEVDKNKMEWTPLEDHVGEYKVSITASDDECEDTVTFTVYVDADDDDDPVDGDDDDNTNDDDDDDNTDDDDDPLVQSEDYDVTIPSASFTGFNNNGKELVFTADITNQDIDDLIGSLSLKAELYIDGNYYTESLATITDLTASETKPIEFTFNEDTQIALSTADDVEISCIFTADPDNVYSETNEDNNEYTVTETIEEDYFLADISIEEIRVYKDDNILTFWVDYHNEGNFNLEGIEMDVTFGTSVHNYETTKRIKLTEELSAGDTDYYSYQVDLDDHPLLQATKFGLVSLEVDMDPNDLIFESDDSNNSASIHTMLSNITETPIPWWANLEMALNTNLPSF